MIVGIPLTLFMTWFAMVQYQDWRYIHPWERIERGDTEQHVLQVMGRPNRVLFEHSDKGSWESGHKIDWYDAESLKLPAQRSRPGQAARANRPREHSHIRRGRDGRSDGTTGLADRARGPARGRRAGHSYSTEIR